MLLSIFKIASNSISSPIGRTHSKFENCSEINIIRISQKNTTTVNRP